jgi:aminoglycoside 6-adenylyltransferase
MASNFDRENAMKTRFEREMLSLILEFANGDERIRATLMNGSRADPKGGGDPFQDYDIANYVTEVEPFRNAAHVLPRFGEAIVVEQPLLGPWPPADRDRSYHNYNIQLLDGNRIDLSFNPLGKLTDHLEDSQTAVLLDKDDRIPPLPPANDSSYFLAKPSQQLYDGCCTGFFFMLGSHIPKTIWRQSLPLLKFYIEAWLRVSVLMMLGWEIGIRTGWEKSIGKMGKDLEHHMAPDAWSEYSKTYVGANFEYLWDSLFRFHSIFQKSAEFVAEERGYRYPSETAAKVLAFLAHVRSLPADSKSIYTSQ